MDKKEKLLEYFSQNMTTFMFIKVNYYLEHLMKTPYELLEVFSEEDIGVWYKKLIQSV